MGKRILLGILGVVVGLIVGGLFNSALVQVNTALHAPEGGLDWKDPEQVRAFMAGMPFLGFVIVWLAHSGQAFLGALVGTLVAGRRSLVVAWIVGAFTLLGCVLVSRMIPSPAWFLVVDFLLPLPAAWLGGRLVLRREE